jgi:hypothetical protein
MTIYFFFGSDSRSMFLNIYMVNDW